MHWRRNLTVIFKGHICLKDKPELSYGAYGIPFAHELGKNGMTLIYRN